MTIFKLFFLALLFSGCATRGEKLRAEFSNFPEQKILDVPFYAQTDYHCGPAALAMVANYAGLSTSADELSQILYTPGARGTYQNDLIAATRRMGLIAVPINETRQIIQEINSGLPILIFQNLGLSWIPKWHYAVVIGYDWQNNEMILHSGEYQNYRMALSTFENTWQRVDSWGHVLVRPGTIPVTASELSMVKATAGLELALHLDDAQISYEKILARWPQSLGALIGLGNIHYQKKEFMKARDYLKMATEAHPQSPGAKNNYALASKAYLEEQKKIKKSDKKSLKN